MEKVIVYQNIKDLWKICVWNFTCNSQENFEKNIKPIFEERKVDFIFN